MSQKLYRQGSYGAWYTAFNSSYPTRFSSIVAFGGSSGFSTTQLSSLVAPPRNVSALSIYAAGGSIDEKQPGSAPRETLAQLDELANPRMTRNWTAVELEGLNHKLMSQDAWYDMGWVEWVRLQQQGGRDDLEDAAAAQDNSTTTSSQDMTSRACSNRRFGWW